MYPVLRFWRWLRNDILALPSRTLVLAWVLGLLALPLAWPDPYVLRIVTLTALFAIFAASWDLLAGYSGQVNFGHALFFGGSAYCSAILAAKVSVPPWLAVAAGTAFAALLGLASGYICLRMRGAYLSLATLAFPLIAVGLLLAVPRFSGGELGLPGVPRLAQPAIANYYIAVLAMLAVVFGLWKLADSRFGLVLHAIRDDELAARAAGIHTPRYKLAVFAISGAAAGLAGALLAHYMRIAAPFLLETGLSFQAVIWGIFGGVATIYGPVAAVFVLYPLTEWIGGFQAFGERRLLVFAAVVLVVLLFMPRGIAPWVRDRIETLCPRCKQRNAAWRSDCRICGAALAATEPRRASAPRA
jgi:branched-chain amino acid transport system permease protein